MKVIFTVEMAKQNRQVAIVVDECSTERGEELAKELRRLDPRKRELWNIEQSVTMTVHEVLTVSVPSAARMLDELRRYAKAEELKAGARRAMEVRA